MKKVLTKILGIIFILVIGYQQFSYADMVVIDDSVDYFTPIAFLVGFIGITILVISAISFFSLKITVKKQNIVDDEGKKLATINTEEIEKKKNRIQRRFYIWGMILSTIGLIYLGLNEEISKFSFFILIILFVISIIIRLNKNKKLSNIICGISVILVCIITLWIGISNIIIENYNNQISEVSPELINLYNSFLHYEGKQQKGTLVKSLILDAEDKANYREGYEKIKFKITYNQTTIIDIDANNLDEISNLRKQISNTEKYDIEIQGDSDSFNIIITSNN